MGTRLDALDLAIANVQSSIPDVSAFVTSLQVRALIDTSLSDYYNKQAIDGKLADYYTKTEIGNNFYTKTQTDALIPNTSNFITTTDNRKLTLTSDASQITAHTVSLNLLNVSTAIQKNNQKMIFYSNFVLMQGDYRVGGASNGDWYIRLTGDTGRGAVIGVANSTSSMPSLLTYMSFAINRTIFYYYNDDQTRLFLNSASLNNAKYFSWVYGQSNLSLFSNRIQLSNLSFDANTVVNSILSSSQTTTPNDTSIPTTLWVQNKLDAIPQTDAYTKTEVDNLIQGIFNKPETFNDDVTFNDVVVLTSTIALGTKVIETVVRSNDDITPSDTNIPSTLWAQNKFNTKVDNGTVYTKVDLNDLLQLTNLSSIVLTYDQSYKVNTIGPDLFLFSDSREISQKLYYNYRNRSFSLNKKFCFIEAESATTTNIVIASDPQFNRYVWWYTILPDLNFKSIKITQKYRETAFCFYETPIVLGTPNTFPRQEMFYINSNLLSVQLSFSYSVDNESQSESYVYSAIDITKLIETMSGENILNQDKNQEGFYFICNGKTYNQSTNTMQTTVRWLFLGQQQSYSFTSSNGSVFFIPFSAETWHIWYGQFQFKAENVNAPAFYDHSFVRNIPSAQRISGGPALDTFVIEIGDFPMDCDMFFEYLTNLN